MRYRTPAEARGYLIFRIVVTGLLAGLTAAIAIVDWM